MYSIILPNGKIYDSGLDKEDIEQVIIDAAIYYVYRAHDNEFESESDFANMCQVNVNEPENICGIYKIYVQIIGYVKEYYEYWGTRISRDEYQVIDEHDFEIEVKNVEKSLD